VDTRFADPSRADPGTLQGQVQCFFTNPFSNLLLEAAGGYLLVLNPQRQILAANSELLEAMGMQEGDALVGLRPGEALHCVHAEEGPHGCGTSSACAYCGAVLSILAAQAELQVTDGECRVLMRRDGKLAAAEFQIRVTPLEHKGDTFLAMVLLDISDQKRKEAFERLFFHDLANTVQCLEGWGEQLQAGPPAPASRASAALVGLVQRLGSQVRHHRMLLQAERGELQLKFQPVLASAILAALENQFQQHELARRRVLAIQVPAADELLFTEPELLQRVLANMILNGLEATQEGARITVWFEPQEGRPAFHVSNPGMMSEASAQQIFHRSYSTKGGYGRGLGTYGMKLLGEDHLGGSVGFRSTAAAGTCFSIVLPSTPGPVETLTGPLAMGRAPLHTGLS
jgi:signal transduction histidine kinase